MNLSDRRAWLRERQSMMMATDIVRVCGAYFDGADGARGVYAEKISSQPIEGEPDLRMRLGTELEPFIAQQFTRETGIPLAGTAGPFGIIAHEDEPWIGATLDRITATGYCECKAIFTGADDEWGPTGSDQVPERVMLQCQWQALAGGFPSGFVAALFVPHEFRWYQIGTDLALGDMLQEIAADFWFRVQERRGVDDWRHPLIEDVVSRASRVDPNRVIMLGADSLAKCKELFEVAIPLAKEAQENCDRLKAELAATMGSAEWGLLPDRSKLKQARTMNRLTWSKRR